jgi:uncharacterized membrane protein SpoIIM required for sporulation
VNEALFLKKNRPEWARIEGLAARLDGSGRPLSGTELFALVSLYRKITGDLARARMLKLHPDVVDYLNQLVGRVHFLVYAPPPYPFRNVLDFFRRGFPQAVRRQWRYVLGALLLLIVPAVAAYAAVAVEPSLGTAFAPPGYVDEVEKAFGKTFGQEQRPAGMGAIATSFYITNNIRVAFLAFALGAFLGLGSVYILVFNGIIVGGVGAVVRLHGLSYNFWSFVASHGGIEIGAILLSGAAGMRIGFALLNPGIRTRKAALTEAGREAGLLMFGVMVMLALAAVIEAWISPSTLPNGFKLAFGTLNLAALTAYLTLAGRPPRRSPART